MSNDQTIGEDAMDRMSVAPPEDPKSRGAAGDDRPPMQKVRTALDADDDKALKRNPSDENAKLDVALDETFPGSDAPSNTQPGKGKDPAPSSGFDADAEAARGNS